MLNKVHLIGWLGKQPEIIHNKDGEQFAATFTLATTELYKEQATGQIKTKTEWHRVSCYNKFIFDKLKKYAPKGRQVYVEGKLKTYIVRLDEEKSNRRITEVIAEQIKLLGGKQEVAE